MAEHRLSKLDDLGTGLSGDLGKNAREALAQSTTNSQANVENGTTTTSQATLENATAMAGNGGQDLNNYAVKLPRSAGPLDSSWMIDDCVYMKIGNKVRPYHHLN
jgi:hypothetical protein